MFTFEDVMTRLAWLLLTTISLSLYFPLGKMISEGRQFKTRVDDYIPLTPMFIVPYLLWYPFLIINYAIALTQPLADLQAVSLTAMVAALLTYFSYIFFPTFIEPYKLEGNNIYIRLVNTLYRWDSRHNAFPSIHVSYSLVAIFYLFQWYPFWAQISLPLIILIILSTVFLKQHYLPDVLGGFVAATIAIYLIQGVFVV